MGAFVGRGAEPELREDEAEDDEDDDDDEDDTDDEDGEEEAGDEDVEIVEAGWQEEAGVEKDSLGAPSSRPHGHPCRRWPQAASVLRVDPQGAVSGRSTQASDGAAASVPAVHPPPPAVHGPLSAPAEPAPRSPGMGSHCAQHPEAARAGAHEEARDGNLGTGGCAARVSLSSWQTEDSGLTPLFGRASSTSTASCEGRLPWQQSLKAGARVHTRGLQPHRSGRAGVVTGLEADGNRWNVELDTGTRIRVRAAYLEAHGIGRLCPSSEDEALCGRRRSPSLSPCPHQSADEGAFEKGDAVRLKGLVARQELNGLSGILFRAADHQHRHWEVACEDGRYRTVRAIYLRRLGSTTAFT